MPFRIKACPVLDTGFGMVILAVFSVFAGAAAPLQITLEAGEREKTGLERPFVVRCDVLGKRIAIEI